MMEQATSLYNVKLDDTFNITSPFNKNIGTGLNPDNTQADIGVYGGTYAWHNPELDYILNIETPSHSYNLNDIISTSLTINNINGVNAEHVILTYDPTKLSLVSEPSPKAGMHFSKRVLSDGKIELILLSNSKDMTLNYKTTLLELKFKCISSGLSYLSVKEGTLSNRKSYITPLSKDQLGKNMIMIK